MTDLLDAVIRTLNGLDVRGEENLDRLLSSLRALRKLRNELVNNEKSVAEAMREGAAGGKANDAL